MHATGGQPGAAPCAQGMADYALAPAGGRVTEHSALAHGAHAPVGYHLTRLAADAARAVPLLRRLVPRTPVHPRADDVRGPGAALGCACVCLCIAGVACQRNVISHRMFSWTIALCGDTNLSLAVIEDVRMRH